MDICLSDVGILGGFQFSQSFDYDCKRKKMEGTRRRAKREEIGSVREELE
jgi:hypothetical protein